MDNLQSKTFFQKVASIVFNTFYFKIILMLVMIPTLLVYTVNVNFKILLVMLAWGAAICLYDFITKRNFLRASGMIWLIAFLAVFLLAVLYNFKNSFNLNITSFGYTFLALVLLYPDTTNKDKNRVLKELSAINYIFIGMTAVLSTVSLIMFITLYSDMVIRGDMKYVVGWVSNRLFGLYANTGYMITSIGLVMIVLQVFVLKARDIKLTAWHKTFLIYTAISNFLSLCLENAKGAFISLAAFIFVFVFFILYRTFKKKNFKAFKTYLISVIASAMACVLFFGIVYGLRPVLSYIPNIYTSIVSDRTDEEDSDIEKIDIERDIPENYGAMTGRPKIWQFGLEEFAKNPLVGYGPQSHREYHVVDIGLRHFHNLIIQCLVSVGIFGSLFIFIFFFKKFLGSMKNIFKKIVTDDKYVFVVMTIFAIAIMFVVNSMAEVTILFLARYSMFLFWMLLGYMITLLSDDKKAKEDLLMEKLADGIDAKLKKKN